MTFTEWLKTEAGQRALEYAEQAPGAGLSMAWDAALESMNHTVQCPPCRSHLHCLKTGECALAKAQTEALRAFSQPTAYVIKSPMPGILPDVVVPDIIDNTGLGK